MNKDLLWNRCVEFHGHACPGLSIGYRAALYAVKLLNLTFSDDEQCVCISENDACGVDAIQVILGCSAGKGNLLFHVVGKSAYSFYERSTGRSVRLVLNAVPDELSREERIRYFHQEADETLFTVKKATLPFPEKAGMFRSYPCDVCGETTAEIHLRLRDGKKLCPDCAGKPYDRYHV